MEGDYGSALTRCSKCMENPGDITDAPRLQMVIDYLPLTVSRWLTDSDFWLLRNVTLLTA
jgi:hypothetical protein